MQRPSPSHIIKRWSQARKKLATVLDFPRSTEIPPTPAVARLQDASLLITYNEICHHHGTGILLERLFGLEKNIIHAYSTSTYTYSKFGDLSWCSSGADPRDPQDFHAFAELIQGHEIRRILCVPFSEADLRRALLARELTGAPLCLYLMDDQNIHASSIRDDLMRRALENADLALAISAEMRDAYESKFGIKLWVLPPTVRLPPPSPTPTAEREPVSAKGILVGNIWNENLLTKLLAALRESGVQVDWFSNGAVKFPHHTDEQMRECGLHPQGYLAEELLIPRMRDYSYSLVLAGSPREDGEHAWLSALSLPSRLPFVVAAGGLPVLALGDRGTPTSNFVERFGVGLVSTATTRDFREATEAICRPDNQARFRRQIRKLAPLFDSCGIGSWIWASLDKGRPLDDRFEKAFIKTNSHPNPWIDAPVPKDVFWQFRPVYAAMSRAKLHGFSPDFVLDVGCSTGVWSHTLRPLFPQARFLLVDPLLQRYHQLNAWYQRNHPDFEWFETALGRKEGRAPFNISHDLYGSSLLDPGDGRSYEGATVPMTTVDLLLKKTGVQGRGLLKIDVQHAEHEVLAGAAESLGQFDGILLELTLARPAPETKTFVEMLALMQDLGFIYHDDAGDWRSPAHGRLLQKDILFLRAGTVTTNADISP